jgi:hypothetical protein
MQRTYPLLPFIGVDVPPSTQPFAPMTQALPDNVELLSLNTQYEQVDMHRFFVSFVGASMIDPMATRDTLCYVCATFTRPESTRRCRCLPKSTLPPCSRTSPS